MIVQCEFAVVLRFSPDIAFYGQTRVKQRTVKPQNIQPQKFEGWNRCALSFGKIKIDRLPSFEIRHSIFDIQYSIFAFLACRGFAGSKGSFYIRLAISLDRCKSFSVLECLGLIIGGQIFNQFFDVALKNLIQFV